MPFKDKDKEKEWKRQHYLDNKELYKKRNRKSARKSRNKKRRIVRRFLTFKGCLLCGYRKCPESLHFHHVNPEDKETCVSLMVGHNLGWRRIREEIKKCIILCANCHGEVHAGIRKVPASGAQQGLNPWAS